MNSFYRENILDHYKNPRNFGKLPNADASAEEFNPFCGDRIGIDVKFEIRNSKFEIKKIKFYGEGCAISMASASMLTENVKGKNLDKAKKLRTNDILKILGIELTPTRLKCALLPLEVLHKTLALAK